MISNLEKEITFRYLKTRKKDGFLNVITIFSFIGISLGVAVLIIVMSVMNGFRSDLIKKINGFNSHATIQNYDGLFDIKKIDSSNLKSQIDGFLISNNGEGIIINEKITKGVLLRGYKKEEFQSLNIVKNQKKRWFFECYNNIFFYRYKFGSSSFNYRDVGNEWFQI